jgi:uncharacterized membrane protein
VNVGETERLLSIAAGGLVLLRALEAKPLGALFGLLAGGGLVYRGLSGHCSLYQRLGIDTSGAAKQGDHAARGVAAQQGERVECSVVIHAPPTTVFQRWRRLSHLPEILRHLDSVVELDSVRSRWTVSGPLGTALEWDAEIINEKPNELIAWRSLPGGSLDTAGSVRFQPRDNQRATELTVNMKYDPPGGQLGAWVADVLGAGLAAQLRDDLAAFKRQVETQAEPHLAADRQSKSAPNV